MGFAGLATQVSTLPQQVVAPAASSGIDGRTVTALIIGGLLLVMRIVTALPHNPAYVPTKVTYVPNTIVPDIGGPGQPSQKPVFAPAPPTFESAVTEVKPLAGKGRWLNRSEILYCLAESARLNVMEPLVDESSPAQLNGYNDLVADYNLRCLDYNYQPSELAIAQRRVDVLRPALKMQAMDRLAAWR
ncbi:hypothetical protein SSBR45G_28350 [Bradyrhizobium sp. SSBR45G]|nr:hypothetical protein SSBR45G_28350 [Bradyrhizobium sp. SSBR45G]